MFNNFKFIDQIILQNDITFKHPTSTRELRDWFSLFLSKNDPIFISTISYFFCCKFFRSKTYWSASCYKLYNVKNVLLDDKPTFLRGSDIFKSQIVSNAFRRIDWGFKDFISSLCSGLSFANNGDCLSWMIFFFNYKVLSVWHSFKTFLKIDKLVTS